MNKVIEIVKAWAISINPSEEQLKLAEERMSICMECDFKRNGKWDSYCDKCGCPLSKKIFSSNMNSCPLNKW